MFPALQFKIVLMFGTVGADLRQGSQDDGNPRRILKDELFPQHPLSRVRACLRGLKESISIREDVRWSEPFAGPQERSPRKSWVSRLTGR